MSYHHALGLDKVGVKKRIRDRPEISDTKENRGRVENLAGNIVLAEHDIRQVKNDIKRVNQKLLVASEFNDRKT